MDISELGRLLVEKGACLRAIPLCERGVFETCHADEHPDGKIVFLPEYKREMLVVETIPKRAGKFLVTAGPGAHGRMLFGNVLLCDTIEDVATTIARAESYPVSIHAPHKAP